MPAIVAKAETIETIIAPTLKFLECLAIVLDC